MPCYHCVLIKAFEDTVRHPEKVGIAGEKPIFVL